MANLTLSITGMTCGGCQSSVLKALQLLSGVNAVRVDLSSASAYVEFDEKICSVDQLVAAVEDLGFDVAMANHQ